MQYNLYIIKLFIQNPYPKKKNGAYIIVVGFETIFIPYLMQNGPPKKNDLFSIKFMYAQNYNLLIYSFIICLNVHDVSDVGRQYFLQKRSNLYYPSGSVYNFLSDCNKLLIIWLKEYNLNTH